MEISVLYSYMYMLTYSSANYEIDHFDPIPIRLHSSLFVPDNALKTIFTLNPFLPIPIFSLSVFIGKNLTLVLICFVEK